MKSMAYLEQFEAKKQLFLSQQEENERAKSYWKWSTIYQTAVLGIGIVTIFDSSSQLLFTSMATILSVMSFILQWMSDTLKNKSQNIYRRFEFADALGWPISQKEVSDTLLSLPQPTRNRITNSKKPFEWFASNKPQGSERLLENLAQNACWTKQIARNTLLVYIGATFLIALCGIVLLFIGFFQLLPPDTEQPIARTIIAVFAFIFTGGYIRLCWEFWELYRDADKVDDKACDLLEGKQIDREEAIKLYTDYQLARAKAPLLPTWVYKRLSSRLEEDCRRTSSA